MECALESDKLSNCKLLISSNHSVSEMDKRSHCESPTTNNHVSSFRNEQMYYGIYMPPEPDLSDMFANTLIFTDKSEALKVIKLNKKARFKGFTKEEEAINFSKNGGELLSLGSPCTGSDKALFSGPRSQELVKFRKAIENNDLNIVQNFIEENPRYLVGSGDTPTILQEGSRYNALHVAARSYSDSVCSYILSLISSIEFMKRLYGLSNTNLEERCKVMVDLYLNTPDKGSNETPLHFASKLGGLDIVKILISYPQCDKLRTNKSGYTPKEIVCTRAPENRMKNKQAIIDLLDTKFYIPVLRSDDNSVPPVIGEPFTATNIPKVVPSEKSPSVIRSPLEVCAFAGPMTEIEAKKFKKLWKTPPRISEKKYRPELSDPDKGLETIGRRLAQERKIQWREYWPFLNSFTDVSTKDGLTSLENYLKERASNNLKSPNIDEYNQLSKQVFDPFMIALSADSPLFNDGYRSALKNEKQAIVSVTTMEKSCQVFASRIGSAVVNGLKSAILSEITKFQVFLGGCLVDSRFTKINLKKTHYRLSVLIVDKINVMTDDKTTVKAALMELLNSLHDYCSDDSKLSTQNLRKATSCIGSYITSILSKNVIPPSSSAEKLWIAAESCNCDIPNFYSRSANCRSLSRQLFVEENKSDDESCSDDEFVTAPSSPYSSDENLSQPDEILPTLPLINCTNLFLTDDKPSRLDKSVMDVILNLNIPIDAYPYVVQWKNNCLEHMKKEPCEKWGTPRKPRNS